MRPSPGPGPLSKRIRGGWVLEALGIGAVCYLYESIRNLTTGGAAESLRHAKVLTGIEQWLGIYQERAVQHFFLHTPAVVAFWNVYYDTAHFLVPLFVAIYLYVKAPARYVRMRNTFFLLLLGVSQIVWLVFPVTSPRWMPERYGFVDTQVEYFSVGPQKPLRYGADGEPAPDVIALTGNPYGGMPSHHVSWAMLSVLALWPVVRRRWVKGLLVAHLLLTIGAITVTGQHRFIDIAGSAVELTIAYSLALGIERVHARRRARQLATGADGEARAVKNVRADGESGGQFPASDSSSPVRPTSVTGITRTRRFTPVESWRAGSNGAHRTSEQLDGPTGPDKEGAEDEHDDGHPRADRGGGGELAGYLDASDDRGDREDR